MNLKDVVSITGKPGLYKVLNKTARGIVIQQLNGDGKKAHINATYQVAALSEITIFSTTEDDIYLKDAFEKMHAMSNDMIPAPKASTDKLKAFFSDLLPEHDEERVYASDIKKVIKWYHILAESGLLDEEEPVEEESEDEASASDEKNEDAEKTAEK